MTDSATGTVREIDIADLLLDPANPRLPPEMQGPDRSQREIALYINKHYEPLKIAESISQHRYFESEPLIAVPLGDKYTVIEGNRRLTALMALRDDDLRADFALENGRWAAVAPHNTPSRVPVLVVDNPEDVAPLLGFRHISGIEPWDPYAQARYIAQLVARAGHTLDEVAELVGRTPTEVKSKYRDYDILEQADAEFGIDTRRARKAFGVFNNAMGRRAVRAFISAPDPRNVDPAFWPLPDSARENLDLLLRLVFGRARGEGRVVTDSRQLGDLAKVLAEPTGRGLAVLQATSDLAEALDAASGPSEQFARAIKRALRETEKAHSLTPPTLDRATRTALQRVSRLTEEMLATPAEGTEK